MTSHNFKRNLVVLEVSKFGCLIRHINALPTWFTTSILSNKGTSSFKKLALKRNTFCPTATRNIAARGLFLVAPGPNRNVSLSGTTATGVACLVRSTSNLSNQRDSARVRARAVLMTPLVVAHRSLPCDQKVMTGIGWGSSVTCSSVSSKTTTFTLAEQPPSSYQWPS